MIVSVGLITPLQLPGLAAEGSGSSQPLPDYSWPTATGPGSRKKSVRKFLNFSPELGGFQGFLYVSGLKVKLGQCCGSGTA
jgi:hypothetical protein